MALPSVTEVAQRTRSVRAKVRSRLDSADLIYLVTTAGFPNFGDELITEAWLRHIALRRPMARVVVDSPRPGQASLLLRHANRRAVFVDTLWELVHHSVSPNAEDVDPDVPWEWVADTASRLGASPRNDAGIDMLLRAGTIHLVGGGYVNAVWPHHAALLSAMASVAEKTGARTVATGAGFTPAVDGAAGVAMLRAASRFDVVDVRDAPTETLLAGAPGLSRTGDDAWLSPILARPRTPAGTGVVLCAQSDLTDTFSWDGRTGTDALASFIRATLDAWDVPGRDVTVVECIPGHDYTVPTMLADRLDGAAVIPFRNLWRDGLPVNRGTWLSTRYHPHMIAAAAGDSGVAISASTDYYATKHQALIDAGSAWTVVSGGDRLQTPARPTAGGYTPEAVQENVRRKKSLADSLYPIGVRIR
ncbi:polysaccharide pyruvyl transferase family protein [Gordonia sp. PDNC005]|uniref:polysaccharide pyruvyl transferase family protein n=1 Tax=unclassified Gordonia (in: high G+C Gram-positive bacteria) TaxID=2657482 RepID=UPI00196676FA|nr:polysaccharide pyruvyl transferase family protein [Gordonia sp. PDNC005]QRY64296.1 polysaccharide pyruvyl transferase family protein [Gordonia sp. PDNC005]